MVRMDTPPKTELVTIEINNSGCHIKLDREDKFNALMMRSPSLFSFSRFSFLSFFSARPHSLRDRSHFAEDDMADCNTYDRNMLQEQQYS